jgi:secreted trypsin-like serine protease
VVLSARDEKQLCWGKILSATTILTGANCVVEQNSENVLVVVGSADNKQKYRIKSATLHENYKKGDPAYDIAILYLEAPIEFNETISLMDLFGKDLDSLRDEQKRLNFDIEQNFDWIKERINP